MEDVGEDLDQIIEEEDDILDEDIDILDENTPNLAKQKVECWKELRNLESDEEKLKECYEYY